jgi:uncharacterized protein YuzE
MAAMTTVGKHRFDGERYDAEGDVLYLTRETGREVATTIATPEGHAIRLDEDGEMIGLTIVNARWLLDRDGKVVVTLPERIELPREELDQALTS